MVHKLAVVLVCLLAMAGCAKKDGPTTTNSAANSAAPVEGVEKVKPAPGTGNVQGKVLYNNAPVENIEVKLCETFSRFLSGCGGKTYTAKTDRDGDYVIANVEPKEYEGLTVRVFDTDSYVFATSGIAGISAAKYNVTADKTLFVAPTHLFKGDLKTVNPKAGSIVSAQDLELKWDAYPDAAYYKFSLHPDNHLVTAPYVNERVEATSFKVAKPLEKGGYRWKVEAFNSADRKLSETADDIKFTIN
ncbi:MAG TPA: carboxypeptidase-like regulatory domain-containing protein [Pyrinomonadaceae bacterium]|nr:carboxypeptidase-like regulatory domain-containing protein [Pyrinomonadaceae bacterium]